MEAKYYTPSIEEFHAGFEYELNLETTDNVNNEDNWRTYYVQDWESPLVLFDKVKKGIIRVKYIDQEDCLSLGLKLKIWSFGSGYFEKGDFTIGINATGNFCTISQKDNGNKIMRFSGNLKNKSELAKIMQQLEIK